MTWILILFFGYAATSVEFNDEQACMDALQQFSDKVYKARAICVPKSSVSKPIRPQQPPL